VIFFFFFARSSSASCFIPSVVKDEKALLMCLYCRIHLHPLMVDRGTLKSITLPHLFFI
jgi:hypothetical protein